MSFRRPIGRRSLLGLAGAILASGAVTMAAAKEAVPVRVGVLSSLSEAPLLLAQARGYFREEGLDVTIVPFANTAEMVAPLATGEIDVGSGAPTLGYFNGVLRGLPMKLVADKGRNSPGHGFNAIVVRKELAASGKVKSLQDLKGLRIASPSRWSPMEYQLDLALRQGGGRLEDARIEVLTFPDMLPALASGVIDGALLIEPFVGQAVARGAAVRLAGVDEFSPDFQIAGILYSAGFTKREDNAAGRWMVAYLRGVRDYLDAVEGRGDREAVVRVLMENTRIKDRAIYDAVVFPGFDRDGYLHLETIARSIDWFSEHGQLRSKPVLADIVDYRYLDYAHERLGRIGTRQTVP